MEQQGKSPLRSKTVWINVLALAAIVVQKATGTDYLDVETQVGLLAVVNLILRIVTKQPLELRGGTVKTWLVLLALLCPTLASGRTLPPALGPKPTNCFALVQRLWDASGALPRQGATDAERLQNGALFLRMVVAEIRKTDSTAGLWRKGTPWGHDGDKVCFKMPAGGVFFVDIIGRSGGVDAIPTWQDGDENYYANDDQKNWMPGLGEPPPVPTTVEDAIRQLTVAVADQSAQLLRMQDQLTTIADDAHVARAESFNAAVRALTLDGKVDAVAANLDAHRKAEQAEYAKAKAYFKDWKTWATAVVGLLGGLAAK